MVAVDLFPQLLLDRRLALPLVVQLDLELVAAESAASAFPRNQAKLEPIAVS